jgi:hypothetical protein
MKCNVHNFDLIVSQSFSTIVKEVLRHHLNRLFRYLLPYGIIMDSLARHPKPFYFNVVDSTFEAFQWKISPI